MRWMSGDRSGPHADGNTELDARLSETWEAAAAAVAGMLDLRAGEESLVASSGLLPDWTAEHRPRAGITGPVAHRRGRLAQRSAGALAAALAVSAVALVAVWLAGERHNAMTGSVRNTAYVVKRINSALSAAEPAAIAQMTLTTRGPDGTTTAEEWSYGDEWRLATNSPSGHPAYDAGLSSSSVYTLVSYLLGAWVRHHRPVPPPLQVSGCGRGAEPVPLFQPGEANVAAARLVPATVVSDLRAEVSCGTLTEAGRQRVDGIEAIELTSRAETIWVNPRSYLPVRVVARWRLGIGSLLQTADIAWLRPTAANLANLTVPIPAGFRQVPIAVILRQIRRR